MLTPLSRLASRVRAPASDGPERSPSCTELGRSTCGTHVAIRRGAGPSAQPGRRRSSRGPLARRSKRTSLRSMPRRARLRADASSCSRAIAREVRGETEASGPRPRAVARAIAQLRRAQRSKRRCRSLRSRTRLATAMTEVLRRRRARGPVEVAAKSQRVDLAQAASEFSSRNAVAGHARIERSASLDAIGARGAASSCVCEHDGTQTDRDRQSASRFWLLPFFRASREMGGPFSVFHVVWHEDYATYPPEERWSRSPAGRFRVACSCGPRQV